jgi:hypothetical protein
MRVANRGNQCARQPASDLLDLAAGMPRSIDLSSLAVGGMLVLLWSVAGWAGWSLLGLYSDAAYYLTEIIARGGFSAFDDQQRLFMIAATQVPVLIALKLGVTDLKWLVPLYSFTLLAVPALFYSLALLHARHDESLLGWVVAAIALVFLPSCLFSIGEYNMPYAAVVLATTYLASPRALSARDGAILLLVAVFLLRAYELLLFLGPLLAALAVRRLPLDTLQDAEAWRRRSPRTFYFAIMALPVLLAVCAYQARIGFPLVAIAAAIAMVAAAGAWPGLQSRLSGVLLVVVAGLFLAGAVMAASSPRLTGGASGSLGLFSVSLRDSIAFPNPQLLLLVAAVAVAAVALRLNSRLLVATGAALLVVLALLPLAQLRQWPATPIASLHYNSRLLAGLVLAAGLATLVLRGTGTGPGRRWLLAACAAAVALLPSTFFAAAEWREAVMDLRRGLQNRPAPPDASEAPPSLKRWYIAFPADAKQTPVIATLVRPPDSPGGRPPQQSQRPVPAAGAGDDEAPAFDDRIGSRYRWRD